MTVASNAYAEKVFAEHPTMLLSLDDDVTYVSLVSNTDREIFDGGWSVSSLTATEYGLISGEESPSRIFPDSAINKLSLPTVSSGTDTVTVYPQAISPILVADQNYLDPQDTHLSVGAYLYTFGKVVTAKIGFTLQSGEEFYNTYQLSSAQDWAYISSSVDLPLGFENVRVFIKLDVPPPTSGYTFLVHGLTLGQKAEASQMESLGVIPTALPDTSSYTGLGVPADMYGLQNVGGYYIVSSNDLKAKNSSIPMVYGASNSTRLTVNPDNGPSMLIKSNGFLCNDGKYSDITFEAWLKIQSSATEPKRILGPLDSQDGLYVNDAFIVLRVGKSNAAYYVGEWDRPMLIAIRMSSGKASLVINGEECLVFDADQNAESYSSSEWLAVYCYEDVPSIEIDCVGIYPYEVPSIVEKRRFVYGQGVETSENVKGANLGTVASIDYTFSKYAKNYTYPDIGKWKQGVVENLSANNITISTPSYSLPSFRFSNFDLAKWYEDNKSLSGLYGPYLSLRPTNEWNSVDSYLLFDQFNLLDQDVKAFYGLFQTDQLASEKQVLFCIFNDVTGEYLEISQIEDVISYNFSYLKTEYDPLTSDSQVVRQTDLIYQNYGEHVVGDFLFVGLQLDDFSRFAGGRVSKFLGSKKQLKLYVGNSADMQNTFSGKIYRVGFCTARNLEKISNLYSSDGLPVGYNYVDVTNLADGGDSIFANDDPDNDVFNWEEYYDGGDSYFGNSSSIYEELADGGSVYSLLVSVLLDHVASYTLVGKNYMGNFVLDIASNGYWQDYIPLSYFAKYVSTPEGKKKQGLDFIQFNIDYPQINKYLSNSYDTTNSVVRTFVSFQKLSDTSTANPKRFSKVILAPKSGVVAPGEDWYSEDTDGSTSFTRYEVVNGSVIYPPQNIRFEDLSVVVHIELLSGGIIDNPIKIKSLQLASQVLDGSVATPVGTKFGVDLLPYRRSAGYYDYKGRNPYSIYKGNTPYLYLTSNSGIALRGQADGDVERGISISINKNTASYYKVAAWQLAMRYDGEFFPHQTMEIFEVFAKSRELELAGEEFITHIKILMARSKDGKRATLYAINANTGEKYQGVTFFINGRVVSDAVIEKDGWLILGFSFDSSVDFSGYEGAFRITGPVLVNNISHYQTSAADEASRSIYRKWNGVLSVDGEGKDWQYWQALDSNPDLAGVQEYTWKNVLFVSTASLVSVDGRLTYKKYTGTDRIVIDSDSEFRLGRYDYKVYQDVLWQTTTVTPA